MTTTRSRRKLFPRIALMGNFRDPRALETIRVLAVHLAAAGHRVQLSRSIRARSVPAAVHRLPEAEVTRRVDLVIAVGGDGSMLYAARRIAGQNAPLLGINRGRLGFLADVGPENMLARLDQILAGRYVSEQRLLLEAELLRGETLVASGLAMNDVVVKRHATGRMVEYQTFVDAAFVNTHLGDGFIVATPTGSTAYALSCGGPIVEPGLDALVLTPICPHTLTDRPLVIPASRTVEVRLRAAQSDRAEVTCDGEPVGELGPGWSVRVRAARKRIELVHPVGYDYFGILRSKLLWGRDTREPAPEQAGERSARR